MRDKPRPRRPAEAVTHTILANVEVFVNTDRKVALQEVANQFGIDKTSAHQISHKRKRYEQDKC